MRNFLIAFLAFSKISSGLIYGQVSVKDSSIAVPLLMASYAYQIPGADMAKRFGHNSSIGLACMVKTKRNWMFGLDGSFLFGNKLKETGMLDSIAGADGNIINKNGEFAGIHLYERAFSVFTGGGKLFAVGGPNPNSGIFFILKGGFLQHKIRIEDIGNTAPQLQGKYKKGYDRLSNGLALEQFVGYLYLGNERRVNFFAGLECIQAFTRSRRSFDYDLMRRDTQKRLDLLYGLRVGWVLPLYKKAPKEYYYY